MLVMVSVCFEFVCVLGSVYWLFFFFQAEDGIRDLVRSRGLGDVYKRQGWERIRITADQCPRIPRTFLDEERASLGNRWFRQEYYCGCLLYTSDAADERSSVDLGGRRIIKKKKKREPD